MHELIQDLMAIKAININTETPFTWASGLKSPIYIDNRLIMSHPDLRFKIAQNLAELVKREYLNQNVEITSLFGTATAGIPHAILTAHLLNKPAGYVRSSKKDHGKGNQIEGFYQFGDQVLVVEDLISTGGSVIKVVETLQEAGLKVIGVIAIFSYDLQCAKDNFETAGIAYHTLLNFRDLVQSPMIKNFQDKEILMNFQKSL